VVPVQEGEAGPEERSHLKASGSNLDGDLTAQIFDRAARNQDAIPLQRAAQVPAAGGKLLRDELSLAEPRRPVGDERAIRRPGRRIFGDSLARREKPVDIIHRVARCGKGNRERIQRSDALEVRLKVADLGFGVEDREQVARTIRFAWTHAQGGDQGVRNLHRFSGPGRKIHAEKLAVTSDRQVPAAGAEDEALRRRKSVPEENVGGGQGRVTAQVDLHRRREPAQGHDVTARDDKSGLGKIVLGGDRREDAVGQQIVQQDHRRRISTEHPVGEGVDLVEGQLHEFLTLPAKWAMSSPHNSLVINTLYGSST